MKVSGTSLDPIMFFQKTKEKDENNNNIINKEDGKGENIDEYV